MRLVAERTALDAAADVGAAIGEEAIGVYVLGSVALGAFQPGSSDLDMIAVFDELSHDEADRLAARVLEVEVAPARQLELVVYGAGTIVLNLNTDPLLVEHAPKDDEWFWFVLDRAIGETRAIPLHGPPLAEVLAPVARDDVLSALAASLDWHERHEPTSRNTVLNAARSLHWLETGEWVAKPKAARALLVRVRAAVEAAR
jgi:predicted nucleotidyltransferase